MNFLSFLPIYLLGNVHCAGMCGPLVMLLAKNPYRWTYFLGRLFSFTLAGLLSAEAGIAFFSFLARYHISALFSLFFGLWICSIGLCMLFQVRLPGSLWLAKKNAHISAALTKLLSYHSAWSLFLFGVCTLLLPCGQTLVVFSLIALYCEPLEGLAQGCLFALLTSPALIAALHASQFFCRFRKGYHVWMGLAVVIVGGIALLRGAADLNVLQHFVLNPSSSSSFHIVIF